MARTNLHTLLEEVAGSLQIWQSSFSGAATLLSPAAGNHLRIYDIVATVSNSGSDTDLSIADGSATPVFQWYLGAGRERKAQLNGHYWQVSNDLVLARPGGDNAEVSVTVYYKERPDGHV